MILRELGSIMNLVLGVKLKGGCNKNFLDDSVWKLGEMDGSALGKLSRDGLVEI